jgi:endonuclease/exonuclease/phosphatase family metal-dependent hydrolase
MLINVSTYFFMKGEKRMGKIVKKLFLILLIGLFFVSYSHAFGSKRFPIVKVLDQNMYLGADLSPLIGGDPAQMQAVIRAIIASNYPARARAMARTIKLFRPDVVCLQEAWIFEFLPEGISWNFKTLLLEALGDDYKEVVTNAGLTDVNLLPLFGVRIKDQDVILAKKNVIIGDTDTFVFADSIVFDELPFPPPNDSVTVYRGLSTARLKIRGKWYTVGNTHLESFHPVIRYYQAVELVDEFDGETEPIILAGDFNSDPDGPAYQVIVEEFDDAWPRRLIGRRDPGFTYGREDLISDDANFYERIDFVFTRNRRATTLVGLTVGKTAFSKTLPVPYPDPPSIVRLWPSDHLGLFFTLILPQ